MNANFDVHAHRSNLAGMPTDNFLTTTSQVIDALGGNGPVTTLTEAGRGVVSNWRGWPSFPPKTYVAMSIALTNVGKSAPASLWGMVGIERARPRARSRKRKRKQIVPLKDEPREGARASA
jgi:hypothetical protein